MWSLFYRSYFCRNAALLKFLLKYGFLVSFLFSTLFYNVRFSFLVLFYNVDNQSFTEAFCENIDKPELECNGSCAITDAKNDLDDPQGRGEVRETAEIRFFVSSIAQFLPYSTPDIKRSVFSFSQLYFFNALAPEVPPPKILFMIS